METGELIDRIRAHLAAGGLQYGMAKHPWSRRELPPPASNEEILKADEKIGFPLPPLLRALYSEIANGGFGPGYGLLPLFDTRNGRGAIDSYVQFREADFDMDFDDGPAFSWAPMLIPINDWGCAIHSCVDCSRVELPILRSDPNKSLTRRPKESPSMEMWLLDWLENPAG